MKYRKKPIEIEARQFDGSNAEELIAWVNENAQEGGMAFKASIAPGDNPAVMVPTKEGVMRADAGDWILRGVVGEFYPCKNDIFTQTYEAVT